MIDVTTANFEAEVIAASMTTPVLVDCWAPWCGPCKTLGPLLEKMETAYGGRFKLVKIDSDQEQQLAAAFGIRSIPTCILLKNGQPVDGFMGAVPEGKLREFLDKHIPSEEALLAESETEAAEALMASGDLQTAQAKLEDALAAIPNVLSVPASDVEILDFNERGTVLAVRPYCHTDHYWQVYFDTNRLLKDELGAAGFPAPMAAQKLFVEQLHK